MDIVDTPAALLLSTMSTANVGEGKTDAKDAYVIAEAAGPRQDLLTIAAAGESVRADASDGPQVRPRR